MRKQIILSLLFFLAAIAAGFAQQPLKEYPEFITVTDSNAFLVKTSLFQRYYKMTSADELRLIRTEIDQLGMKHEKYQQYYKGIPVDGAVVTVHSNKDGRATLLSGRFVGLPQIGIEPSVPAEKALALATKHVGAKQYMWEDLKSAPAGYEKPAGTLVLVAERGSTQPQLAFMFDIYAVDPLYRAYVYVNARTGQIIRENARIHHANVAAGGASRYNGTVNFTADSHNGSFRLRQTASGSGVETYNMNNGIDYGSATDFTSANANSWTDPVGVQAHWGAEQVYDYFLNRHGRNSYDNAGAKLLSYVHFSSNFVNAFWDGSRMTYGDGNGVNFFPLVTLDICGHEIAHAVTEHSAGLVYCKEPGALNESFSDIFGEVIERYASGSNDWLLGDEIGPGATGGAFRSMRNPNAFASPDTYGGFFWQNAGASCTCNPLTDYCGVHTNSGVQNKWFYILSEGESGTNDNGDRYCVNGIGMDKAAAIAYRNLTVYLSAYSNYTAARTGAIQAARDLFGNGSAEEIATTNAWFAVGVGVPFHFPPGITCPTVPPVNTNAGLCSAVVTYPMPVAETNCPVITQISGLPSGSAFPVGTTLNVFRVTDASGGSSAVCAFSVVVNDAEAPSITCPSDKTVSCESSTAPAATGSPTVFDNCGIGFLTHIDTEIAGDCPGNYTINRRWVAFDVNGNGNSCTQNIAVQDIQPPVTTCPPNITVVCDTSPDSTGYATAADNCDPSPSLTYSDNTVSGLCEWLCTIERTWLSSDFCGNVSQCVQTIEKNTLPLLEEALAKDINGDGTTDTLVLGVSNSTLTIPPGRGNCIQKWLPGSGTQPSGLKFRKVVVGADCRPGTNPVTEDGKLANPLLAEALHLNIMVRLNPDLGKTKLSEQSCTIAPIVIHYLAKDADIDELLRFTNTALGNVAGQPHLKELLSALQCINAPLNVCDQATTGSAVVYGAR